MNKEQYREYLKSDDWKQKRSRKWEKSSKRCAICGSVENLDTHHLNYKNLFDVTNGDLKLFCRRCHYLAHDLMSQGKIKFKDTDDSNKKYWRIRNKVRNYLGLDDERHEKRNQKLRIASKRRKSIKANSRMLKVLRREQAIKKNGTNVEEKEKDVKISR